MFFQYTRYVSQIQMIPQTYNFASQIQMQPFPYSNTSRKRIQIWPHQVTTHITVGCRYNAVHYGTILHTWLQWLRQNVDQSVNPQKHTHISP